MAEQREVFGTAFLESGDWVIRYVTGEGAKVPIVANADVKSKLVDGAMVRLDGYLSSDGTGRVVGAIASDAEVIGSPQA